MSPFRKRRTWVTMIVSVGDYQAGCRYKLPVDLADSYIAKWYADGTLSRPFSPEELNSALRSTASRRGIWRCRDCGGSNLELVGDR